MPKLTAARIEARKRLVEDAALVLFRQRGFHGVGLREIADAAGVSIGNIYNHFGGKEEVFSSLLERLERRFRGPGTPLSDWLEGCAAPVDYAGLGRAVKRMVAAHRDYLTLIYVDIAEFEGRHVRAAYQGLLRSFRDAVGERLGPPVDGLDPVVGLTAAYMQFFNFFIVESMIGARGHLGLKQDDAIHALAGIFQRGLGGGTA